MRYDLQIDEMLWSYSRLTAYESCPYQWLMKYIFKIKGQSKFFAEYGSLIHSLLQKYLTGKTKKEDLPYDFISGYLKDIHSQAPSKKIYANYFEQGKKYLSELNLPERKTIGVEKRVRFQYAGHPFIGFIDWLSEDADGKLYITDHKSRDLKPRSKRKKATASDKELDKYLRQLYVYSKAVYNLCRRYPDYLEFNCFRTGAWITEPFDREKYIETEKWASELIEKITSTDNWYANGDFFFCNNLCDVCGECEYFEMF